MVQNALNMATHSHIGNLNFVGTYQFSFPIYGEKKLWYFSYEYATFFFNILHYSPLNYCHISFEYTFISKMHWVLWSYVLRGLRIVSKIPPKQQTIPADVLSIDNERTYWLTLVPPTPPPLSVMHFSFLQSNAIHQLTRRVYNLIFLFRNWKKIFL